MKGIVLGASGFLGRKIYDVLKSKYEVIGTYNSNSQDSNLFKVDITNKDELIKFLEEKDFDFVIDTVAIADPEACMKDKEKTKLINVEHVRWLCDYVNKAGKKLVYISSDYVFDGNNPPYIEENKKNPINFYGETKADAEDIVLENPDHIIIRPDVLYGYNGNNDKSNFFSKVYKALSQGNEIQLDNVRKRDPTLIDDIAIAIGILLEQNAKGIYHLGTKETMTHYDFGIKVAEEFGFAKELIKESGIDKEKTNPRPENLHLICEKIEKLGVHISSIEEALEKIHEKIGK